VPNIYFQILNLLAAIMLLITFAMLSQRRPLSLNRLFIMHGSILVLASVLVAYVTKNNHLYYSAGLTFAVKVVLLPWILHKVIIRLKAQSDIDTLINVPTAMLIGIVLVIIAFNLAMPIAKLSSSITSGVLGIALACILLSFMMILIRSKAMPQVIGFLTMENGLLFAATAATSGMPMIVELGLALAVVGGTLILGVFMFQIREQYDDLDIDHLENIKED
jgi:hydrogenase-4 component E